MEAAAAFGVAANVLQVVDFAHKLLSTGHQIYQAGSTIRNDELECVIKDFTVLNNRLKSSIRADPGTIGPLTEEDQSLEIMVLKSEMIAADLLKTLIALHAHVQISKYKSFLQAIRTDWSSRKVADTKQRLNDMRAAIQFHLQVTMKQDALQCLAELDDAIRQVLTNVLQSKDEVKLEIINQQQASEASAQMRHEQLLTAFQSHQTQVIGLDAVLNKIKARLYFQRQDDRHDDIDEAHQSTFQWVLKHEHPAQTARPNLNTWLRAGQGIYWISGKAGSGKSTLMKYLQKDPKLDEALQIWAGDRRRLVLSFYFWSAGSDLQRSQEGLFRSLLYQALAQEPSLAETLFPECYVRVEGEIESFTFHQIRRSFRRLTAQLDSSIAIILLIDGLDEFDAVDLTMPELADIFTTATTSTNIKALLSSRPLTPFEFAFSTCPKMRLHELTNGDITTYVNNAFATHPRVAMLMEGDLWGTQTLIKDIVDSALGVFLWVRLVVCSLLEGLHYYESLSDLRKRLQVLPRELESLLKRLMNDVPDAYKVQFSQILQLERYARGKRKVPLWAITILFMETDGTFVMDTRIAHPSDAEQEKHKNEVEGRLRSRFGGFLELQTSQQDWEHPYFRLCISLLHKSVADFLAKEDVWCQLTSYTAGTSFDPAMFFLQSTLMQIKRATPQGKNRINVPSFDAFIEGIRELRTSPKAPDVVPLVEELDRVMSVHELSMWKNLLSTSYPGAFQARRAEIVENSYWWHYIDPLGPGYIDSIGRKNLQKYGGWHDNFLAYAVSRGMEPYVRFKLGELGKEAFVKRGKPLLEYASCIYVKPGTGFVSTKADPAMVLMLLEHGADPNEIWGEPPRSVWQNTLQAHALTINHPDLLFITLQHLVRHGADVNVLFTMGHDYDPIMRLTLLHHLRSWIQIGESSDGRRGRDIVWRQDQADIENDYKKLIALLVSKGAREEQWVRCSEWHYNSAGKYERKWVQVYWNPLAVHWRVLQHVLNLLTYGFR